MKKHESQKYKIVKNEVFKNFNFFEYFSLIKILFFFPFIFGFGKNFYDKYKNKSLYFISKNIYIGKNKTEEKIEWETFNFFLIKNIDKNHIKSFHVYKNILLLDLKKSFNVDFFGIIKNKNISKIKTLSNKFFLIQSKDLFIESLNYKDFLLYNDKIYYKNDIIPEKINKIFLGKKVLLNDNFFNYQKNIYLNKNEKINKKVASFSKIKMKRIDFTEILKKEIFYSLEKKKSSNKTTSGLKQTNSNFEKIISQFFYINKISFFNKNVKKHNIYYLFKNNFFSVKTIKILQTLEQYNKIYKNQRIEKRLISGYRFIDKDERQSLYYVLNKIKTNQKLIKIALPSNMTNIEGLPNFIVFNKFFINNDKNGFLGMSRENRKNQNLYKRKIVSFQKNLKPQPKKFRKIDDFSTDYIFYSLKEKNEFLNSYENEKQILFSKKKSKTYIYEFSNVYNELLLNNINNSKYTIIKKLTFLNSQKQYIENWEFISNASWLFITKFFLIIYLFYLLNELYKNYAKELIGYLIEYEKTSQMDFENIKEQYFYDTLSFRIIRETNKKIKDIVGIDFILPEIGEILLLLKTSKQTKKLKKATPKGFLITGAPGTGKTLLVQAIAGESKVPVLIQSAGLLINNKKQGQSHKKLKNIFHQAKKIGPAIIFIDEIDSLGKKRNNVISNSNEKQIEFFYSYKSEKYKPFIPNRFSKNIIDSNNKIDSEDFSIEQEEFIEKKSSKTNLTLLTQFLIEMDGIQNQEKFIVFGATNRLKSLDPAFIRPGRFDKIITLEIPSKTKRIQILKFYSKTRKIEKKISWMYLSKKTSGFTASELASIMNESAIQSILKKTNHTIETIEKGIDYITSYSLKKQNSISSMKNLSYYEAGKTIGLSFIDSKNNNLLLTINLFNRKKNTRHEKIYNQLLFQNKTKIDLENLLIYFYLGKSCEFIYMKGKKKSCSQNYFNSFFNQEDSKIIQHIAFLMIDQWYLYSINILLKKQHNKSLKYQYSKPYDFNFLVEEKFTKFFKIKKLNSTISTFQENGIISNLQSQINIPKGEIKKDNSSWYRLYLSNPDQKMSNLDWIPPDLFIHKNVLNKNLSKRSNVNSTNLYDIERDYYFHCLILNSFNNALFKIEDYREWVDYFATLLLRYGILRENEVKNLF